MSQMFLDVCDGVIKPSHSKGFSVSGEQIFIRPVMQPHVLSPMALLLPLLCRSQFPLKGHLIKVPVAWGRCTVLSNIYAVEMAVSGKG